MNNISNRIDRLEKSAGAKEVKYKTWVLMKGEPKPKDIAETDTIIYVIGRRAKTLTEHLLAGEGSGH